MANCKSSARLVKVAAIREPGWPVGSPAPCYLNCPCGARPRAYQGEVRCACGQLYTDDGYLITSDFTYGQG